MSSKRAPDRQTVIQGLGPVRRFGRYLLVKKLAVGGMAEIWLALQESVGGFKRFLVVKKILSHLLEREEFVRMFLDEARTTVALNHPNIVKVYDLGEADGGYFLAMEYIDGETLSALTHRAARQRTSIGPELSARIIADAARALHYAHTMKTHGGQSLGVVHRDISPQNILLSYEGDVKVVDFGIAKAATQTEGTQAGTLKGKYSYMSPEQIQGQPLDGRSDVFALAVTLYELVTGTRLFKHDSELMILEMVTRHEVPPPSAINPTVSPELDAIILKGLEKERDDRYATAEAFQIALEEYLNRQARPSTSHELARLMQSLFADQVAEKALIREIASEPEFEATYGENPPPRATPRAPAQERRPGTPPGLAAPPAPYPYPQPPGPFPPGTVSGAYPQSFSYSGGYPVPTGAYPAPAPPPDRKGPVLIVAFSILLLLVLGVGSYLILAPGGLVDLPMGTLDIISQPPGAIVYVDGERPRGASGLVMTPSRGEISLPLRRTVRVRLTKPGYKEQELEFTMTPETSPRVLEVKLEPFPVPLTVDTEPSRDEVEIRVNGKTLGRGSGLVTSVLPEVEHEVSASLSGYRCETQTTKVGAGASGRVLVVCAEKQREKSPGPGAGAPGGDGRGPKGDKLKKPDSDADAGKRGLATAKQCEPDPRKPSGAVFNSRPYTEVYFQGRKLGDTPVKNFKLPSGCLEITFVNPKNGKKVVKRYEHAPNRTDYRHDETLPELE